MCIRDRGEADDVGAAQRIAGQALEEGTAQAERRTDQDAGEQARQSEVVDHEVGARAAVAQQSADDVRRGDRVRAGAEREDADPGGGGQHQHTDRHGTHVHP